MPTPNYGNDELNRLRHQLVMSYGLGTVMAAEASAVIDMLVKAGFIQPSEYLDLVQFRCQQVDQRRQDHADRQSKGR